MMKVTYLGTNGPGGTIDLPTVTTEYERIATAYPDREARYCHPAYDNGKQADKPLAVWQWEAEGHAPGRYGSADKGLPPVASAPQEELDRLSAEITAALDEIHAHPEGHPEAAAYLVSCAAYGEILREIDAPYLAMDARSPSAELDAAASVIDDRETCTRPEMATIIRACEPVSDQGHDADWWAKACRDITLVSVTRGYVRYDQPGQLPGGKCATLMFAPSGVEVADHWADRIVRVTERESDA